MKISELQEKLESAKELHGDLEISTHADGATSSLGWVKVCKSELHLFDKMDYPDEWNLCFVKQYGSEPK